MPFSGSLGTAIVQEHYNKEDYAVQKGGRVKTTFRPFIVNLRLCILNHLTVSHSEPVMTRLQQQN